VKSLENGPLSGPVLSYRRVLYGQGNQDFERLKQKYQPVLNLIQQLRVQLQNLNMQGSQLLISGTAPSAEAKNEVWDQVKLIANGHSDSICDITEEFVPLSWFFVATPGREIATTSWRRV
jgi:hypothetical protein